MYELDLSAATPQDVIRRSIVCHPSLFIDAVHRVANIHAQAAETMNHSRACDTAKRLREACNYTAGIISGDDTAEEQAAKIVLLGMDYWISSLNVAAKLQCIPSATIHDIVARYEAQREVTNEPEDSPACQCVEPGCLTRTS